MAAAKTKVLLILGLLVAAGAPITAEAATMRVPDEVRTVVSAIVADEIAAWNSGDAVAFAARTTSDVVFTNIVGMFSVGREPFTAQHARIFATIYKGSTMTQAIEHIALVRPDVVILDTLAGVSGYAAVPPGVVASDGVLRTRLEQVLVRNDGMWSVASFHNVPINGKALSSPPK